MLGETRICQDWSQKIADSRQRYSSEQKKQVSAMVRKKTESYKEVAKAFDKVFGPKHKLRRKGHGVSCLDCSAIG